MLILARKIDEKIFIGEDIEIMVTEINRHTVKLGISAPKEVKILREELMDKEKK